MCENGGTRQVLEYAFPRKYADCKMLQYMGLAAAPDAPDKEASPPRPPPQRRMLRPAQQRAPSPSSKHRQLLRGIREDPEEEVDPAVTERHQRHMLLRIRSAFWTGHGGAGV